MRVKDYFLAILCVAQIQPFLTVKHGGGSIACNVNKQDKPQWA